MSPHGTLLFSDVCTFTRWGHKVPGDPAPTGGGCARGSASHGPTCGTSYSAMQRLTYATGAAGLRLHRRCVAKGGASIWHRVALDPRLLDP